MVVLDTDVVSETMREEPGPTVAAWTDRLSADADRAFARFAGTVLPLDAAGAALRGDVVIERARAGAPISTFDALLAAIVRSAEATLATRDTDDLTGLGLDLVDPWDAPASWSSPGRPSALKRSGVGDDTSGVTTTAPGRPVTVGPRAARRTAQHGPRQDAAEVDELVRAHLPIVGYQVNETMARLPGHVHRDDMVSAGLAALAAAAAAFDATTGVPFARYATLRIRGALMDELRSMDWAPRGVRTRAKEMAAAEDRLAAQLGRRPDRAELAASLGCSPDEVEAVRRATDRSVISLDAGDGAVAETLAHPQPSPEDQAVQGEQVRYLRAALSSLPERLRTVVEALFVHDRTPADVAAELGVSESRISQIRSEALVMLKDGMNTMLEPGAVLPSDRPGGVVDRKRQAYFAAVATAAATRRGVAGIAPAGAPERIHVERARPTTPPPVPQPQPLSSLSWGERFG